MFRVKWLEKSQELYGSVVNSGRTAVKIDAGKYLDVWRLIAKLERVDHKTFTIAIQGSLKNANKANKMPQRRGIKKQK